jgi:copper homeostasis protein
LKIKREACVGTYAEAIRAAELGAERIELCDNLADGGTTPSYGTLALARRTIDAEIFPIIRPRGGGFVYSEEELQIMENDIQVCRELGIDGVVFGVLTPENEIDVPAMRRLIECAGDMAVACHLAFDLVPDRKKALDTLVELGVIRTATTGSRERTPAIANLDAIKETVEYAAGRIIIMPARGVTKDNYLEIVEKTGVTEVHGTRIVGELK